MKTTISVIFFSIVADDAITIPQYLSNRFLSKSYVLQVICAIVFLIAYTIYSASSIKACGTLFNTVIGIDETYTMYLAAAIIIGYTFLGGFQAVCWTDFYQGRYHLRLRLGPWLLRYAAYHHPLHVLRLAEGNEKICDYRYQLDCPHLLLCYDGWRSRPYVPRHGR